MASPATCGRRRASTFSAMVEPPKGCKPLSTWPMRVPRPPARIRPLIDSLFMVESACCYGGSAADIGHFDFSCAFQAARQARRVDGARFGIAVGALAPHARDGRRQFGVAAAFAQQGAQIVAAGGEQAGVELAFGRQADARAILAKGLRDARE